MVAFFIAFLIYPLWYAFTSAFVVKGEFSTVFFRLMITDPAKREAILNSLRLGVVTTLATTLLALPLAFLLVRNEFPGKGVLNGLMLVPMVLPPFVGAIGMKQMLARFGSINLLLLKLGLIDAPIDWFGGGGFAGVVILEGLHLYPIMYLNVAAALANVDPSLEEAARNVGASGFRLFRTITFPLMLPGYFAGAVIVFIWAFTDLGTPLVFAYRRVVAVDIFNAISDINENPMAYAEVVLVLVMTVFFFYLSKTFLGGRRYEMIARGHVVSAVRRASPRKTALIYAFALGLTALALLPHVSVLLTSLSGRWFMTVLPEEVTFKYYGGVFTHDLALSSVKMSLFLSVLSTVADVVLGVAIAYLLARTRIPGKGVIDALAMLPLALPGLVLAFGYLSGYSGTFLDARNYPVPLLVISYAVRRLPYMVRSAYAGLQQTSVALEEASQNVGAGPARTLLKITFPLILANLVAGGILCFAFAMLEVSDSLILALKSQYYPITKAIYELLGRIADGPYIASAMGMLGMILLGTSLFLAGKFLGRRMGELFRA
ncbi:MAG: ABC transporter permease [Candidatus Handelsmanbacteria bacterium RIFCSPLOWO2_12_FULL_64_10]|uniref:ABC transporter permease n=1 Tax=Handelsmanbacteria sp. (strain RIFCSPLOWO2_12_FULL_64_10) TaxID=1817868 RepID=A0A1F6CXV4_HANXR|nr:MAG: ABC transporter permease [Candidatus Handelsmanbacteria bacterium RIFCSPLOWO2_12_FULL_64_10]